MRRCREAAMSIALERFREMRGAIRMKVGAEDGEAALDDLDLERLANRCAQLMQVVERAQAQGVSGPDVEYCRADLRWHAYQIETMADERRKQADLARPVLRMSRGQRRKVQRLQKRELHGPFSETKE